MAIDRKYGILLTGLLLSLLPFSYLYSEKKTKKETSPKSQFTFEASVNVVVVNATVTDKEGNPVTDLTAKDFRVYDNGKPQNIQTFAIESYGPVETEESEIRAVSPKRTEIRQNDARPRMISIFIDDLTMYSGVEHFPRLKDAVKAFVQNEMGPMDQVALLSGSGRAQIPFTRNKQQLLDGIAVAFDKLNYIPVINREPGMDYRAWKVARRDDWGYDKPDDRLGALFYYLNARLESETRNLLFTLRQHIRALKHFEGAKSIVIFSDGFIAENETPESAQLQEIIDLALRSGIILNTSNIRGVENFDLFFKDGADKFMKYVSTDTSAQESPLIQMAHDTGGMFIHNSNDMHKQLKTIARRQVYYYIMSYGMPAQKKGGLHHSIKLEVTRPGLDVSYRKGYYTAKEDLAFENRKKEDIIEALTGPGNMNEIPMNLSYNYSQEEDSTYEVSFLTNVNVRKIRFGEEGDRRTNQLNLVLAVFDENDRYINGLEKSIDFRLQEGSYSDIRDRGLKSTVEFKLPVGRYKIKAVVREGNQGKMGSITKAVEIP